MTPAARAIVQLLARQLAEPIIRREEAEEARQLTPQAPAPENAPPEVMTESR